MDVRKILSLFRRWFWLLILLTILGGVGGYYFSSRKTPIYQTSTEFMLYLTNQEITSSAFNFTSNSQFTSTIIALISSEQVIERASEELGFSVSRGQATAEDVINSPFIVLSVKDNNPEHTALIANKLVEVLIDEINQLQGSQYTQAEKNLEDRIEQVETQMMAVQDQINEITTSNIEESLTQVQNQITDLQDQINELDIKISDIDPLFASDEELLVLAGYQDQVDQLTPVLELYQQIYTNLVVLGQPLAASEDTSFSQLDQLETTFGLYRQIYINSVASLEQLRLEKDQNLLTVIQTRRAGIPSTPISPKPFQSASLYAFSGLLIAGVISFLVEYLDDTIKTPEEVKDILNIPVIGLIADMNGSGFSKVKGEEQNIFVEDLPRSPVSEAFRSIRTSLEFFNVDQPLKTIVVTSSGPEDGKTTIATNLAAILAKGNKTVLLLDADLRRPRIHNLVGVSNRIGLSDLLRGRLTIPEVIQTCKNVENLTVITSGSLPPNPAELIASKRMSKIIQDMHQYCDIVVIDTPPAIVTDSQLLASQADGVIFTIRPGKTRLIAVKTALEEFGRVDAKIIGVVMNRIPRNREYYYGGYDYYAPNAQFSEKYYRSGEQSSATAKMKAKKATERKIIQEKDQVNKPE